MPRGPPVTDAGGRGIGYTAQERCFRGQINEFRIWNKA